MKVLIALAVVALAIGLLLHLLPRLGLSENAWLLVGTLVFCAVVMLIAWRYRNKYPPRNQEDE